MNNKIKILIFLGGMILLFCGGVKLTNISEMFFGGFVVAEENSSQIEETTSNETTSNAIILEIVKENLKRCIENISSCESSSEENLNLEEVQKILNFYIENENKEEIILPNEIKIIYFKELEEESFIEKTAEKSKLNETIKANETEELVVEKAESQEELLKTFFLQCKGQGKKGIFLDENYWCSDYCSENNIPKAIVGECSSDFKYCNPDTKQLEASKCAICGCPLGSSCVGNGKCSRTCSDGTNEGECSFAHEGEQCVLENNVLILKKNCLECGDCGEGEICGNDGKCYTEISWIQTTYDDFSQENLNSVLLSNKPENIAVLGTAYASSLKEKSIEFFTPSIESINDNNWGYPIWISSSTKNQYIGIQWDYPVKFNKILFYSDVPTVKTYKVQYLKNDVWVDISSLQTLPYYPIDYPDLSVVTTDDSTIELTFNQVESNGIRILFPDCASGIKCHISELEVYDTKPSYITISSSSGIYISKIYDTNTLANTTIYNKIYFDIKGVAK